MGVREIGCRNIEGIRPAQDKDKELSFCERDNELLYSIKAVICFERVTHC
jgi:hypothetical protein